MQGTSDPTTNTPDIAVVIPALNEIQSIVGVIQSLPDFVTRIIVADNGSTDGTGEAARSAGAHVVSVPQPGYGRACLAGIAAAGAPDVIVFMDADGADDPADMEGLLEPIISDQADMVIGARTHKGIEKGALTTQQQYGNTLACFLMKLFWGGNFTDLGPFRAIRYDALQKLSMENETFGWTVEMQVRALKQGLRCTEIPVHYRKRIGVSKISGTVKGVILAGVHILGVIGREAVFSKPRHERDVSVVRSGTSGS